MSVGAPGSTSVPGSAMGVVAASSTLSRVRRFPDRHGSSVIRTTMRYGASAAAARQAGCLASARQEAAL